MTSKKKSDVTALFTEYKVKVSDKQTLVLRPWDYLQTEELAPKIAEVWETVQEKFPGFSLTREWFVANAPGLLRTLPKEIGDIVWISFCNEPNEEIVKGEVERKWLLRKFNNVKMLELIIVIAQQNILNAELIEKVGELLTEMTVSLEANQKQQKSG